MIAKSKSSRAVCVIIIAVAFFYFKSAAFASCYPDVQPVSADQLVEAEETFGETESAIQRVIAFGTLLRTGDPSARHAAIRMGYASNDLNIRAAALRCEFLDARSLTIDTMPLDEADDFMPDITDEARAIISRGITVSFPFYYVDAVEDCASINGHYNGECKPSISAIVSGLAVSFNNDRNLFGRFELGDDGVLMGQIGIWNGRGHDVVPAIAILD